MKFENKIRELLTIIKEIDYKTWKIISYLIEKEYQRVANKNVPDDTETLLKNIMQELN